MYSLLTMVGFSKLIGVNCFHWSQSTFCIYHQSQLIWACVATFHGRHNLPIETSMHHQHVVAGLWSCSIPVAQREREVSEGKRSQEDQVEVHLCGRSVSVLLNACVQLKYHDYTIVYHTVYHPMNPTWLWVAVHSLCISLAAGKCSYVCLPVWWFCC